MKTHRRIVLTLTAAALATLGSAAFAETGILTGQSAKGEVLTDASGMTLYTYDNDKNGVSSCYGKCAKYWPPLLAPDGAEADDDFDLVPRKSGAMQWTFYGKPLYLWSKDKKPGDVSGDGKGGVWHIAQPEDED